MKKIVKISIILLCYLYSFNGFTAMLSDGFPIKAIPLQQGEYIHAHNQNPLCLQGELKLVQVQNNKFTLMLGAHPLVSHIGLPTYVENMEESGCELKVSTEIEHNKIKSISEKKCLSLNIKKVTEVKIVRPDFFHYTQSQSMAGKNTQINCQLIKVKD